MDLVPASALDDFRAEVRNWLLDHGPAEPVPAITRKCAAHVLHRLFGMPRPAPAGLAEFELEI
jgi:hypothetical protein